MPSLFWKCTVLTLAMAVCLGHCPPAWAQPADEFEEFNDEIEDYAPPPPEIEEESPLLVEPETPEEFFDAVLVTVRLGAPRLARQYLEQFLALDPDEEVLLELRDRHGPAPFLNLANIEELRPLSTQLLDRVNEAFRERGADPQRIDALIADLSGTPRERETALTALRDAGPIVVPHMLRHLGDPQRADQHAMLVSTLARLGNQVVPPLLAAVDSPHEDLRPPVIEALGLLGSREAVPYLWHPAFAPDQPASVRDAARRALARILHASAERVDRVSDYGVAAELRRIAREHYRNEHPWPIEEDGSVLLWTWQPEAETVGTVNVPPQAASLFVGTRFAREALALSPEKREAQTLFLGLALASEGYRTGWDRPLPTGPGTAHDVALTAGADLVATALTQALENANAAAALATVQVLGQIGTRHQLSNPERSQSPLVAALDYPDPRVQFAAATAILQLDPESPFRGSERVVSILARALNDSGSPHSLVVDGNVQRAGTLAGLVGEMGYDPLVEQTGREGFRTAAERMDVELIFLHLTTTRWDLSSTVANLRADARTADIPIVLYGPEARRSRVESLMARYPRMTYLVESTTSDHLAAQLRPFLETIRTPPLTADQRTEQTAAAAYWLAHIARGQRANLFNLAAAETALLNAIQDPRVADPVLRALAAVPTADVQTRLQETAVTEQMDADIREMAAWQLAFHIQRFGLLISQRQVAEIQAAWRADPDPAISTALASVIGSLQPNAARIGERLQAIPRPPAP